MAFLTLLGVGGLLIGCAWLAEELWLSYRHAEKLRRHAEEVRKEEEFQLKHPEVWRQRELLKLEKERLAAAKELADQHAARENTRSNVGMAVGIGRAFGWW